jgi:putative RNA 2'-phosphotransferase
LTLNDKDLSKVVSHALRHEPWLYELELDEEGWRALYGHSLPGRIRRRPAVPPARLFHGTAPDTWAVIGIDGLLPMRRQFVHLSVDRETAVCVGRRKSARPVIVTVDAVVR